MKYFYPYITNENECLKCLDCATGCPVQAIQYEVEWHLDKEKCGKYQKKIQDMCIGCMETCRKKIIQLKE